MFNQRHGSQALSTCNLLGVTFLLLIVAGSYDVSADLNSEFVKGKSEFRRGTSSRLRKCREHAIIFGEANISSVIIRPRRIKSK